MTTNSIQSGRVRLDFDEDKGGFSNLLADLGDGRQLAPNYIESLVFYHALRLILDEGKDGDATQPLINSVKGEGSSWLRIIPLCNAPDKILLAIGLANLFVPLALMDEVYQDMCSALRDAGLAQLPALEH